MPLTPGSRLGPYEILSPLGAGGMGEVHRARDSRLDRDVAIKVLPPHLTNNAEFKLRFEREAKSISQLTHPHICTLYDVGRQDGMDFLVMELLDGETLAARLGKGFLPLEDMLRLGSQIAAALGVAHRKDVIHRDLKPGNIMLTKTGAKLLDFGLAKSTGLIDSDPSAVTVSQPLTSKGAILGTFQYMAPEQLEGVEADARTDIFALGAVLYEMATGKRAFEGGSRASLIASIMTAKPRPLSEMQPMTPPSLDRLIRKCLAKDPDARWQSAADVADELRWIAEEEPRTSMAGSSARPSGKLVWLPLAAAVLLAIALSWVAFRSTSAGRTGEPVVWSQIPAPDDTRLVPSGDLAGPVVVSPDGSSLAFVAASSDRVQRIWVRPLNGPTARMLPETDGASFPFWSGDSRHLGFFAREKLYTVTISGGPAVPVCAAPFGRGGTWNRSGTILFSPDFRAPIYRVSATGGTPVPVTTLDPAKHTTHRWPSFCPDGEHFLYLAVAHGMAHAESNAVFLGSLDGAEPRLVMHGSANAACAAEQLLFLRGNALMAAPFDLTSARLLGEPAIIATNVLYDLTVWKANFSVSDTSVLTFHSGALSTIGLARMDRNGRDLGTVGEGEFVFAHSISPDGKKLAAVVQDSSTDIWIYDVIRGNRSRLTFGKDREGGASVAPVWSPDGQMIAYAVVHLAQPERKHRIFRRRATGGDEELLYTSDEEIWPSDWSPDGSYLLFSQGKYLGGDPSDIWILPLLGDRTPIPFLKTSFIEDKAKFSPDGRWVAFASTESGRHEVYVAPVNLNADDGQAESIRRGKWQISLTGGTDPYWSVDGKELYYAALGGAITAVEVNLTETGVEVGAFNSLFTADIPAGITAFVPAPDGQWFIVNKFKGQQSAPITLITNWPGLIKKP